VSDHRTVVDVAPAALAKVIAAVALVWLWLHLWQLLMVLLVAVVVAIGLEPMVVRLERRGVSRALASAGLVILLAAAIGGFFWVTGASLSTQARELGGRVSLVRDSALGKLPPGLAAAVRKSGGPIDPGALAGYAMWAGRTLISALVVTALILILTIYLLTEGRQTYRWLVAYAPPRARDRVHLTACEAHTAIYGYVVGNVATSAFAAITVFVALTLLHVPAALLLALLAGVFDFVPVLGFICSAFPAVLLALTRSAGVAAAVAAIYIAYHTAENYYIGPRVYGGRLKLSNLAVILAFAVGAEIGGIGGALLALPLAALYPVVERVWLKDYLNRDAIETHERMQRDTAH
jgi:predicted PurR-regulated permease PerM